MKEFDIIDSYFRHGGNARKDVDLGIGDDCAVVTVPQGQSLVVTTDTLVAGTHFFADINPADLAYKALAVNLSDLAAMGAEPAWISLSLSLPEADSDWLQSFSAELHQLTDYYSVQLIGGDTVQGPLSVTITAHGFVPVNSAISRAGAKPGDWLYVTGCLGDAGVGLKLAQGNGIATAQDKDYFMQRLLRPTPRVLAGTVLRRTATACIDVSDGLISDLAHLLAASRCGVSLQVDQIPLSDAMRKNLPADDAFRYALSAGDDYELLFSVSEEQKSNLELAMANANVQVTCIGQFNGQVDQLDLRFEDEPFAFEGKGFEHF